MLLVLGVLLVLGMFGVSASGMFGVSASGMFGVSKSCPGVVPELSRCGSRAVPVWSGEWAWCMSGVGGSRVKRQATFGTLCAESTSLATLKWRSGLHLSD